MDQVPSRKRQVPLWVPASIFAIILAGLMFLGFLNPIGLQLVLVFPMGLTAIDGGFIGVTNDEYLNEAPESGYQQQYKIERNSKNTTLTFFLKSRGGQIYGHFQILDLYPGYRDKDLAGVQIEFYLNPAGSRNLEFDPSKQTEYTQK